jgi:hypothetical protein
MKLIALVLCCIVVSSYAQELYTIPPNTQTGWSSFENPNGNKGQGGQENKGAKGHPADVIMPSESKVLLNLKGAGIIRRIWITIDDRSPQMLRSLKLEMFWDNENDPAVSVPFGDFFGVGLVRVTTFQNALFANPEGRSFNCYIPMPFRKAARIVITNESTKPVVIFFDVDFLKTSQLPTGALYFHAHWNRNNHTKLGEDFEILPRVNGKGRFLGSNLGIITDSSYGKSWWGEGEVKMFLDGDTKFPTLAGTGTEDYIGSGWGQNTFIQQYQGCTVADELKRQWAFYRYHIPDPVYFTMNCRVVIQQMGGDGTDNVKKIVQAGAVLLPVTVSTQKGLVKLLEMNPQPKLTDANFPDGWTNFYRLDNYSATSYFYLDKPANNLPPLASLKDRTEGLLGK